LSSGENQLRYYKASTCGFSEPPEGYSDPTRVIELNANYVLLKSATLWQKYHMKDLVIQEIFEDLLNDEVRDEEGWENCKVN
jgi:hypothetical protein